MLLKTLMVLFCVYICTAQGAPSNQPEIAEVKLQDIASQIGLRYFTKTWSGDVNDYDGNGYPDILISRHGQGQNYLFLNFEGNYKLHEFGRRKDRHDCTSADVNFDGFIDVYCTVGAGRGAGEGPNDLYLQGPRGQFEQVSASYGVQDQYGRGRWTIFFNANGDDYPDLFVGNDPDREDQKVSVSKVFLNSDGVKFTEVQNFKIGPNVNPFCVVALDLDKDGFEDLLICDRTDRIRFYANQNGTGLKELTSITNGATGVRALVADLDSDGELDLVTLGRKKLEVRRMDGRKWGRVAYTKRFTNAQDMAIADADGDGVLDIFVIEEGCARGMPSDISDIKERNDMLLLNRWPKFEAIHAPIYDEVRGCGHQVFPVDSDLDQKSEFLVLNGKHSSDGPLQLLSLEGRP